MSENSLLDENGNFVEPPLAPDPLTQRPTEALVEKVTRSGKYKGFLRYPGHFEGDDEDSHCEDEKPKKDGESTKGNPKTQKGRPPKQVERTNPCDLLPLEGLCISGASGNTNDEEHRHHSQQQSNGENNGAQNLGGSAPASLHADSSTSNQSDATNKRVLRSQRSSNA